MEDKLFCLSTPKVLDTSARLIENFFSRRKKVGELSSVVNSTRARGHYRRVGCVVMGLSDMQLFKFDIFQISFCFYGYIHDKTVTFYI